MSTRFAGRVGSQQPGPSSFRPGAQGPEHQVCTLCIGSPISIRPPLQGQLSALLAAVCVTPTYSSASEFKAQSEVLRRYMQLLASRTEEADGEVTVTALPSQTYAPLAKGKPSQTMPLLVQQQGCQVSCESSDCVRQPRASRQVCICTAGDLLSMGRRELQICRAGCS